MQSDANGTIVLPANLDHAAARELFGLLRETLAADRILRLDAAAVTTLTIHALQLILSAKKTTEKFAVINASEGFLAAFKDAGFEMTSESYVAPEVAEDTRQDLPIVAAMPEQSRSPSSTEVRSGGKRILTIDDSKTMRDMLLLTLNGAGFEVLQAVDGLDGLEVLKRERVDVIITDINMPRMNGYEVIEQVRAIPAHKNLPILVLTTESDQDNKVRARDAGANGWIVKPFDPQRLADVIYQVSP
jgi:two-component system, chemotaxis family, chemotaxis protein CheY